MQDRLNEQWVDQGWEAMKLVLDREMPEKRRRVAAWWWWAAAAAFLGGAFLFWPMMDVSHEKQYAGGSSVELPTQQLAGENDKKPFIGNTGGKQIAGTAERASVASTQRNPSAAMPAVAVTAKQGQKNAFRLSGKQGKALAVKTGRQQTDNHVSPDPFAGIVQPAPAVAIPVVVDARKPEQVLVPAESSTNSAAAIVSPESHPSGTAVASADQVTQPEQAPVVQGAAEIPLPEIEKTRKLVGFSGEVFTGLNQPAAGLSMGGGMGVLAAVPLGPISLSGGLGLERMGMSVETPFSEDNTARKELNSSDPSFGSTNKSVALREEVPVQFNAVYMPVLAQFQLGRKWKAEGGIRLGYLLGVNWRETVQQEELQDRYAIGTAAVSAFAGTKGEAVDINEFNRWDAQAVLGVSWQLTNNWSLNLNYRHGIENLVKSSGYQSFTRALQVGARYRLFQPK